MELKTVQEYKVQISDVGPDKKFSVSSMWNYMQETAWNNAASLGFSVYDLHKIGVTWVVYRLKFTVYDYPNHGDHITVHTWPSGLDKYFVYRDFRVYNSADIVIAEATSTWLVLDLKTRKLVTDLHKDLLGLYSNGEPEALERATNKIEKVKSPSIFSEATVQWFDLDPNEHANNAFFIKAVVQSIPYGVHKTRKLHQLDIQFKKECSYGVKLEVRTEEIENGFYLHEIVKQQKELIVIAHSVWR